MIPDTSKETIKIQLADLTREAEELGATASAVIPSKEIQVTDHLAELCNGEYTCPNYGLAASCPPYVKGPVMFRQWLALSEYAIVVKIELPESVMFSDERKNVNRLLHQIVSGVEKKAIKAGFKQSKGFAGGSCKNLFCNDYTDCCVIAENKPCRNIDLARPSMSGFGIDVMSMMKSSGWSAKKAEKSAFSDGNVTSWIAGLVMIA